MSVLNSHLILSMAELESFAFYYIAELTLDVERDRVGERDSFYTVNQAGIAEHVRVELTHDIKRDRIGECAFHNIAELTLDVESGRVRECVSLYIADQAGIVELNLHLMLSVTGLESVSPSILLTRQV
jgi:hypothetical protein